MSQASETLSTVAFAATEIVIAKDGAFQCLLSPHALESDLSLVIDIYDLDNPVHPDGHLGWWQFPVNRLSATVDGSLSLVRGVVDCELTGLAPAHSWKNSRRIKFKKLIVNAVLRANITNAIVYLDKVPTFKNRKELADFRAVLNRNWNLPRFASPGYIFPRQGTVRIVSRNIFPRDAVGNLCLNIYRMLRQNDIPAEIYCHTTDLALNDVVRRVDRLGDEAAGDDQLLYFHSTYEPDLERLLNLKFKRRIAYFHGVTKPELLQVFDPELAAICHKGIEQMGRLQEFDLLAANSRASAAALFSKFDEKSAFAAADIRIIPPCLLGAGQTDRAGFSSATDTTKLLYVGRIKSNKKIDHLLELFAAYRQLDSEAELWIVGGGADKAYWDYLKWTECTQLELPEGKVHWVGSVSDSELAAHYASATAYVSMSEDEGFCLPVFEAMLAGVPVLAYGLPAVREVMQESGVYFLEKEFGHLASSLYAFINDPLRVKEIISRQRERAQNLAREMDGRGFLELFEPLLPSPASQAVNAGK